jgi:hypothetical protein
MPSVLRVQGWTRHDKSKGKLDNCGDSDLRGAGIYARGVPRASLLSGTSKPLLCKRHEFG